NWLQVRKGFAQYLYSSLHLLGGDHHVHIFRCPCFLLPPRQAIRTDQDKTYLCAIQYSDDILRWYCFFHLHARKQGRPSDAAFVDCLQLHFKPSREGALVSRPAL